MASTPAAREGKPSAAELSAISNQLSARGSRQPLAFSFQPGATRGEHSPKSIVCCGGRGQGEQKGRGNFGMDGPKSLRDESRSWRTWCEASEESFWLMADRLMADSSEP